MSLSEEKAKEAQWRAFQLDFDKLGGLVPAIIQDEKTSVVLMLGFMNREAFEKTIDTKKVTFYSRTRQCLWTKGETSGNFLNLVSMRVDCDHDTLLVKANPIGPVCHTGSDTCWDEANVADYEFLSCFDKDIENAPDSADETFYAECAQILSDLMKKMNEKSVSMKSLCKYMLKKK